MIGMRLIVGIVVSACACEIMGAISKLVNVKAVKGRNIGSFRFVLFDGRIRKSGA